MRRPSTEAYTREESLGIHEYLLDGRIDMINIIHPVLPMLALVSLLGKTTAVTVERIMCWRQLR